MKNLLTAIKILFCPTVIIYLSSYVFDGTFESVMAFILCTPLAIVWLYTNIQHYVHELPWAETFLWGNYGWFEADDAEEDY